MMRHRPVTADENAAILRLHHVEGWPVGTIADQTGRHHDTVEHVLSHAGLGVKRQSTRVRLVEPYLPLGDAVRFHPTLSALAGHYRFEPKACAPYCPNEKGRVERAILDVRENFFAARDITSVEHLNEQARAWCVAISHERKVPDARAMTVHEAFVHEKASLIALANDDFPVEERVRVRVGKTPYVRFDKNDYSVPHTHVVRSLEVAATSERVRILDPEMPERVLAEHTRSFDRDQRIERPEHLQDLLDQKRRAHQTRGFDRLFGMVPSSRAMMERIAERGGNLGATTSALLILLERTSAPMLERAVAEVLRAETPTLRAVHHALDRLHHQAGEPPALSVSVTRDARALVHVRPHALSTYDQLHGHGMIPNSTCEKGADDDDRLF